MTDPTLEAVLSAHRRRDARGAIQPAAAWFDLTPAERVAAFDAALTARAVEAALDPAGLSPTAHAVLARVRAAR